MNPVRWIRNRLFVRRLRREASPLPTPEQTWDDLAGGLIGFADDNPPCAATWPGECFLFPEEETPEHWHVCCDDPGHQGHHGCACGATLDRRADV